MTNEPPDKTDIDDDVEWLPSGRVRPDAPSIASASDILASIVASIQHYSRYETSKRKRRVLDHLWLSVDHAAAHLEAVRLEREADLSHHESH